MIDHISVEAIGGSGGNGCVSFRREKYVPRGGPDGGDGGNGGSVSIVADRSVRTLKELGRRRVYRAGNGDHGKGSRRNGHRGKDVAIIVPVGTEVRLGRDGALLADLNAAGQSALIARGGLGGRGNAWFARADYQAPRIAQRGQRGVEVQVELDLKLLADVGIIGLPNVGKSTLLRAISAARPRVGDYPFTTREAVLGVVDTGVTSFVVADVPGLVADAHQGRGLGLEFLRHVERTRVLIHLLDGTRPDPVADMGLVMEELVEYSAALGERRQVAVVNKLDLPEVEERMPELQGMLSSIGVEAHFISALARQGVEELVREVAATLSVESEEYKPEAAPIVRPKPVGRRFDVVCEEDGFRVEGERVVTFVEMMPVEVEEGRQELWRWLNRRGVSVALRREGAQVGDRVHFGQVELQWPG